MNKFNFRKNTTTLLMLIICLFFSAISLPLFAQENKSEIYQYARKIVDTMTSESMHGRGYVNEGDKIAANYIRSQFQNLGLKSFTEDYYQKFSFPVNTFPGEISFTYSFVNDGNIVPFKGIAGKNFLVSPASPSATMNFSAIVFDSTYAKSSKKFEKFRKKIKSKEKKDNYSTKSKICAVMLNLTLITTSLNLRKKIG